MASIEERLAALEERLGMESGLRASMDSDLASINSKLSAQHHLIQALSITQADHTETLRHITETLTEHSHALQELRDGQHEIIGLLNTLIQGNGEEESE